jgi:hypothetical protein
VDLANKYGRLLEFPSSNTYMDSLAAHPYHDLHLDGFLFFLTSVGLASLGLKRAAMLSAIIVWSLALVAPVAATILQNGQVRITDYPNSQVELDTASYTSYPANATEISYKGRWDSKKVSWWA